MDDREEFRIGGASGDSMMPSACPDTRGLSVTILPDKPPDVAPARVSSRVLQHLRRIPPVVTYYPPLGTTITCMPGFLIRSGLGGSSSRGFSVSMTSTEPF